MLFNLLSVNKKICCAFSFYFLFFNSLFTIHVEIDNSTLQLALVVPTGAPITVTNYAIEILPVVTDKTINDLSK